VSGHVVQRASGEVGMVARLLQKGVELGVGNVHAVGRALLMGKEGRRLLAIDGSSASSVHSTLLGRGRYSLGDHGRRCRPGRGLSRGSLSWSGASSVDVPLLRACVELVARSVASA